MKCPCCGAAELIRDTRDLPYTYGGYATVVPAITGDFCPACNEGLLDRESGDVYGKAIAAFRRELTERGVISPRRGHS